MDKIDIIEEKVKTCVKLIKSLREQNGKITKNYEQLLQEREMLESENNQVRKVLGELERLKSERKFIQQKLERLAIQYKKLKLLN